MRAAAYACAMMRVSSRAAGLQDTDCQGKMKKLGLPSQTEQACRWLMLRGLVGKPGLHGLVREQNRVFFTEKFNAQP